MIDNKLQFGRETETVPKKNRSQSFKLLRWISWDKTSEYFTVVNLWNSLRRDLHPWRSVQSLFTPLSWAKVFFLSLF